MVLLLNGDCLEEMKSIDNNSIDLIFCDLPYGQTNCKWDCKIDLDLFWKEVMRIKTLNTPIFMTTTTKFGVELINSCPKKCPFRYDLVWVKSAPAGFLLAKKMPMRKHEMVYVFYEKLPFYDLSSHKHKFIKEKTTSVVKEETGEAKHDGIIHSSGVVGVTGQERKTPLRRAKKGNEMFYDPPLPVSVVKEESKEGLAYKPSFSQKDNADNQYRKMGRKGGESAYDPPLPTTMLEIKSSRGKHSTEKPVALMEWILKYFSKEGDIVLDPTMGSGSTGVACKNLNRDFIGIELDKEIYDKACDRIKE
jgi:site-specific DNA-methyltransferase (adenine-specific)